MKREFLKGLDLSEDAIETIMAENGRDIERFKAQSQEVESLKQRLSDSEKNSEEMRNKSLFDFVLKSELAKCGAKNQKALTALLDIDSLTFEEGKINGLSEQIYAIKNENGFLFEEKIDTPRIVMPQSSLQEEGGEAIRAAFGLK